MVFSRLSIGSYFRLSAFKAAERGDPDLEKLTFQKTGEDKALIVSSRKKTRQKDVGTTITFEPGDAIEPENR